MSDNAIQVDTEMLISVARDLTGEVNGLGEIISAMRMTMQNTASYWTGEAAELQRRTFDSRLKELETVAERFSPHAEKLRGVAENYLRTKHINIDDAAGLPNNPFRY